MPIFLILTLLFAIWVGYEIRKNSKIEKNTTDDFWKREIDANFVRPKDISSLDYIKVPVSSLPFHLVADQDTKPAAFSPMAETEGILLELSSKQLLNLNGISNTDLKYKYGARNFDLLASCDQNYLLFIRNLNKWAHLLYDNGEVESAKTVLEYAISIRSDISGTYKLLAQIYQANEQYDKISELIEQAESLETMLKEPILQALQSFLEDPDISKNQ